MNRKLIIYGCGGHARSIANIAAKNKEYGEIIFVDENAEPGELIMGFPVYKTYDLSAEDYFIFGVGDNLLRKKCAERTVNCDNHNNWCNIISHNADTGMNFDVGKGVFISSGAYIGPETKIGNNVIINTGSIVEHECSIGDNSHIAPNSTICGRCVLGQNVFAGAGTVIRDKIKICDNVIIGAGTVVVHDILEPGTYAGVPARMIRKGE